MQYTCELHVHLHGDMHFVLLTQIVKFGTNYKTNYKCDPVEITLTVSLYKFYIHTVDAANYHHGYSYQPLNVIEIPVADLLYSFYINQSLCVIIFSLDVIAFSADQFLKSMKLQAKFCYDAPWNKILLVKLKNFVVRA